jgi:hypothetical protein
VASRAVDLKFFLDLMICFLFAIESVGSELSPFFFLTGGGELPSSIP